MSKIVPKVPVGDGEIGNSIQISPAIRWCFTLNNYSKEEEDSLRLICSNSSKYFIWGYEIGEEGTPHLQGYIEFKKKCRPISVIKNKRVHWEKCKGTKDDNFNYCSKGGHYFINGILQKPLKVISDLRPWQDDLMKILIEDADDRSILWYWEKKGNIGKSAFCKYLCFKHNALIVSGKIADMKNAIMKWFIDKGYYPSIVIFDVPREALGYINYTGIEEIKNGCFYSGKYEGGMVLMNSPHVLVFANEEPNIEAMSKDRWNIVEVGVKKKVKPSSKDMIIEWD